MQRLSSFYNKNALLRRAAPECFRRAWRGEHYRSSSGPAAHLVASAHLQKVHAVGQGSVGHRRGHYRAHGEDHLEIDRLTSAVAVRLQLPAHDSSAPIGQDGPHCRGFNNDFTFGGITDHSLSWGRHRRCRRHCPWRRCCRSALPRAARTTTRRRSPRRRRRGCR